MAVEIEFNQQLTYQNYIDIDDIGQCAIEMFTEEGFNHYIVVTTSMGSTTIATCGPINNEIDLVPNGFNISLTRMDFNEQKIIKFINLYLNNKKLKINSASEIDMSQALDSFKDLGNYLRNGGR